MAFDRLLDLQALIARVEEAYGPDAVSRAIADAYAAVVRELRTPSDTDASQAMRAVFRRELETLMREH